MLKWKCQTSFEKQHILVCKNFLIWINICHQFIYVKCAIYKAAGVVVFVIVDYFQWQINPRLELPWALMALGNTIYQTLKHTHTVLRIHSVLFHSHPWGLLTRGKAMHYSGFPFPVWSRLFSTHGSLYVIWLVIPNPTWIVSVRLCGSKKW